MMDISFFSITSSIIWCSVLILLTHVLRRGNMHRERYSIFFIAAFYAAIIIRGFLPLDFQKAIVISDTTIYPRLYEWFTTKRGSVFEFDVTYSNILVSVWTAGIAVQLFRYVISYSKTISIINTNASPANQKIITIFDRLREEVGNGPSVSICEVEKLNSPYGIGVFKKRILIPAHTYTEEELYFVLRHEYTHFLNHDIFLKQTAMLFCIVFWWNPTSYLLRNDFEQALELRCDADVTKKMKKSEKIGYLSVIVKTLDKKHKAAESPYTLTGLSMHRSDNFFKERFDAIISQRSGKGKSILLAICSAALLVFSYFFIVQPHTNAPENPVENFDEEDSYIIRTDDNEFWLYRFNFPPTQISGTEFAFYQSMGFDIIEE